MKTEMLILTDSTDVELAEAFHALTGKNPSPLEQVVAQLAEKKPVEEEASSNAWAKDIRVFVLIYNRQNRQSFEVVKKILTQPSTPDDAVIKGAIATLLIGIKFIKPQSRSEAFAGFSRGLHSFGRTLEGGGKEGVEGEIAREAKALAQTAEIFHRVYRVTNEDTRDYEEIGTFINTWLVRSRLCTQTMGELLGYRGRREQEPARKHPLAKFTREQKLIAELALRRYLANRTPSRLERVRANLPALKDNFLGRGSDLRSIFLGHLNQAGIERRWNKGQMNQWMEQETWRMGNEFS